MVESLDKLQDNIEHEILNRFSLIFGCKCLVTKIPTTHLDAKRHEDSILTFYEGRFSVDVVARHYVDPIAPSFEHVHEKLL